MAVFVIVLLSFVVGWYFYPMLPERVASHWNAQGEVNGTMPRFWGTFIVPLIALVMLAIFMIVPRVDPKRENIERFMKYFDAFIIAIFLFLLYVHALTLAWNLGSQLNLVRWLMPAFAALFWVAGVLVSHAEPNWTVGIRTPWTLSSETVWRRTHALSGKLFKVAGSLMIVGFFWPAEALWFLFVPIIAAALVPAVCSYFWYRSEMRQS